MRSYCVLLLAALLLSGRVVFATTWDEPWQETVVKQADSFVLVRVTAVDAASGISATVLRTLAGSPLAGPVRVSGFYGLHLCSVSGNEKPGFPLAGVDSCYLFLQKQPAGAYAIATPTAGYAVLHQGRVVATYRHSYHQALVPAALYEATLTAIFRHYHGQAIELAALRPLLAAPLALAPAPITPQGAATFFRQHAALETAYHVQLALPFATVQPFLRDTANFHAQVSAVRALTATHSSEAKQALLDLLANPRTRDFVKVLAVQTLASYQPRELKPQLLALARTASTAEVSFGGNIMDPRVCTHLPTVREALQAALAKL